MNHFRGARFCVAATVLAVFAGLAGLTELAPPVFGGEPIIIPNEKGKAAPQQPEKKVLPRDVFKLGERITAPSPSSFDMPTMPIVPSTLDPGEQRRRKLERLERENWMLVAPGELQEEDREKNFLNVRDGTLEGLDKEDGNLMFRNVNKEPDRKGPAPFRSAFERDRQRWLSEKEEEKKEEDESKQGTQIGTGLNFKKIFDPREGDSLTPKFNKSELTLQNLLSGGAKPQELREREERREEFQRFLDRGAGATLSGPLDPINQGRDLTRQPFNPTMPDPLGGGVMGSSSGFGTPPVARPGSAPGSVPNVFGSSAPRAESSTGPLIGPRAEQRGPAKPTLKYEPPRRKF